MPQRRGVDCCKHPQPTRAILELREVATSEREVEDVEVHVFSLAGRNGGVDEFGGEGIGNAIALLYSIFI